MNRRQTMLLIILSVVVVVFLGALIVTTIDDVNSQIEQDCFDKLEDASKLLAVEIKRAIFADRIILSAMAGIISGMEKPSNEKLCEALNTYRFDDSFLSYTALLYPDSTMLFPDGSVRDVSETLSFAEEAAKGAYISNRMQSSLDADETVIRNAVPIVQNGSTLYILYGVIRLSDLAEKYKTDIYDGQAHIFIVAGDNGDFLLDTWHKTFGNINDYTDRKPEPGYSWDIFLDDLKTEKAGRFALTSGTIGEVIYLRYDPIGVNNGSIMLMVPQSIALHKSQSMSRRLYGTAAIFGATILLYMLYVTLSLFHSYRRVRKLSNEDQVTGLQNRNAYERTFAEIQSRGFASLCCIFADVNGLHNVNNIHGHKVGDQMLQIIAGALLKEFPYKQVFRVGGDEFVVISQDADANECKLRMERVAQLVAAHDYSISYGIAYRENGVGIDSITQEADEKMLESKRAYYAENERLRS